MVKEPKSDTLTLVVGFCSSGGHFFCNCKCRNCHQGPGTKALLSCHFKVTIQERRCGPLGLPLGKQSERAWAWLKFPEELGNGTWMSFPHFNSDGTRLNS